MLFLKIFKYPQYTQCSKIVKQSAAAASSVASSSSSTSSTSSAASSSTESTAAAVKNPISTITGEKKVTTTIIDEYYGQPTYTTHPHIINKGELVPGQGIAEFLQRRSRLMSGIQKFARDDVQSEGHTNRHHLVIIPSASKKYMSDKIPYVFRQNSDFYYLTGCLEPDTLLMMYIDEHNNIKSTMFMRPKDRHAELWDGPRTGVDNAVHLFGVDEAYPFDNFKLELSKRLRSDKPLIWYDAATSDLAHITNDIQHLAGTISLLNSPANFLQSMRLFKSQAEQDLMRRTCLIASEAINEVMYSSRPGNSEHHLYAMVDYFCRLRNANYLAYPPVVAAGQNATFIHYVNNTQLTKTGDIVLMDAGCEYAGYTSDITRTWPIGGTFTEPQKVIYEVVLCVQKELIASILKEGGVTLDNLFDSMCVKLGKYLQEVGLVSKDIINNEGYAKAGYKFCPHHVSHYLGMDVHDTPLMPRTLRLMPGMVFTVEPGVYIAKDCLDVPPEFRGIGIRVEDDILITANNEVEVLTSKCLKERKDLENLFKTKPDFAKDFNESK